jgi:hypothetical protein
MQSEPLLNREEILEDGDRRDALDPQPLPELSTGAKPGAWITFFMMMTGFVV